MEFITFCKKQETPQIVHPDTVHSGEGPQTFEGSNLSSAQSVSANQNRTRAQMITYIFHANCGGYSTNLIQKHLERTMQYLLSGTVQIGLGIANGTTTVNIQTTQQDESHRPSSESELSPKIIIESQLIKALMEPLLIK